MGEDIVRLNVGGQKFTTTRSTLCQAEDSVLAAMFSSRWEGGHIKDDDGAVFLDYEPELWVILMTYLRQRRMAGPNPVPHPIIKPEAISSWDLFIEYLGLKSFMECEWPPLRFDIFSKDVITVLNGLTIQIDQVSSTEPDDGKDFHRTNFSNTSFGHAICSKALTTTTAWRCRITLSAPMMNKSLKMALGVVASIGARVAGHLTFGWSSMVEKTVDYFSLIRLEHRGWTHGRSKDSGLANDTWGGFHDQDEAILRLDKDAGVLEMVVIRNGTKQKILKLELPTHQDRWYFVVYLGSKTAVDMLPLSSEQLSEVFDETIDGGSTP